MFWAFVYFFADTVLLAPGQLAQVAAVVGVSALQAVVKQLMGTSAVVFRSGFIGYPVRIVASASVHSVWKESRVFNAFAAPVGVAPFTVGEFRKNAVASPVGIWGGVLLEFVVTGAFSVKAIADHVGVLDAVLAAHIIALRAEIPFLFFALAAPVRIGQSIVSEVRFFAGSVVVSCGVSVPSVVFPISAAPRVAASFAEEPGGNVTIASPVGIRPSLDVVFYAFMVSVGGVRTVWVILTVVGPSVAAS